jgi:hypothetical protein
MYEHQGGCHCGNLRWTLSSALAASELPVRACQCGFCRRQGALSTSDRQGELAFAARDRNAAIRYRFATNSAEFLICARCGIYVGAQMEAAGHGYGIANLRTLEGGGDFAGRAQAMDYSTEDADARRARRISRWTPLKVAI